MSIFYSHVIRWTFLRSHLLLRWLLNTKLDFSIKKWNSAVIVNQNSVQNVYASKIKNCTLITLYSILKVKKDFKYRCNYILMSAAKLFKHLR